MSDRGASGTATAGVTLKGVLLPQGTNTLLFASFLRSAYMKDSTVYQSNHTAVIQRQVMLKQKYKWSGEHTSDRAGALGKGDLKAPRSVASAPSTDSTFGSSGFLCSCSLRDRASHCWLRTTLVFSVHTPKHRQLVSGADSLGEF